MWRNAISTLKDKNKKNKITEVITEKYHLERGMITRTFLRNLGYHYFIYNFILIHTLQNTALKVRKLHHRVGLAQLSKFHATFSITFFFSKSRLTFSFTERIEANSGFLLQTVTSHKNQEKALKIPERRMFSI